MLDIYAIRDDVAGIPEDPDESSYVTSIELSEHMALESLWLLCESAELEVSFFEDSRLSFEQSGKLLELFRRWHAHNDDLNREAHQAYAKLEHALDTAVGAGKGIVTYCD